MIGWLRLRQTPKSSGWFRLQVFLPSLRASGALEAIAYFHSCHVGAAAVHAFEKDY